MGCIVSNFYIKSQPGPRGGYYGHRCIVSNFYIKSQPHTVNGYSRYVV